MKRKFSLLTTFGVFTVPKQIKTMEAAKKPGVIINMGSASGLYPLYSDPIYSASKG